MLFIVIVMIVILAVAGIVLAYVAFPHHRESLPAPARLLGEAMGKAIEAAPTINPDDNLAREQQKASLFD